MYHVIVLLVSDSQWHFNYQDKANCLNDYLFTTHTDNSLSQIHYTEHKVVTIIEVLNPNKASNDDRVSHKMIKGVSKFVSKPLCILIHISFEAYDLFFLHLMKDFS